MSPYENLLFKSFRMSKALSIQMIMCDGLRNNLENPGNNQHIGSLPCWKQ